MHEEEFRLLGHKLKLGFRPLQLTDCRPVNSTSPIYWKMARVIQNIQVSILFESILSINSN